MRGGTGQAVLFSLLLLAAGCSLLGESPPRLLVEEATESGFESLRDEKWSYAMGAFRKALEIDPDHAPARYGLGRVFTETGYLDGAEREFLRAAAIDTSYGLAHLGLARLYYRQDRLAESEAQILLAERGNAGDLPDAHYLLGLFAERRGAEWEAEEHYRTALLALPDQVEIRLVLVALLRKQERYDDALLELERERFPRGSDEEVRIRLADCRLHLHHDLEAERLFRRQAIARPTSPDPVWGLVILALRRSDPEEVRKQLLALAPLSPEGDGEILARLSGALRSPDPFFDFLGACRESREEASEALRIRIDRMVHELAGEKE